MLPLILANISGRRGFSLVTAIVVALGTTTFLVLVGLTEGTFREIERRMTNTNADLMVHKADWSPAVGSGWPLKLAMAPLVEEIEGVANVIPVKIDRIGKLKKEMRTATVYGLTPEDFRTLYPGERLVAGRAIEGGLEMVIDEVMARAQGIAVGDRIPWLGGEPFEIVGIVEEGVTVRVFVPAEAIDRFNESARGRTSFFFVKCRRPGDARDVGRRIEAIGGEEMRRLAAIPLTGYVDALLDEFSLANKVIYGVTVVSLITSSMIIFLTMYQAVTERTREIGILKSLGATRKFLGGLVLGESVALCVMGIAIGTGISLGSKLLIETIDPTLVVGVTWGLFVKAAAAGLVGGALGAIYPGYVAAQLDPVVALNYE
jgi:putative ABC transport system permease protein